MFMKRAKIINIINNICYGYKRYVTYRKIIFPTKCKIFTRNEILLQLHVDESFNDNEYTLFDDIAYIDGPFPIIVFIDDLPFPFILPQKYMVHIEVSDQGIGKKCNTTSDKMYVVFLVPGTYIFICRCGLIDNYTGREIITDQITRIVHVSW